jgi:hypothetical protein
MLYPGLRTLEGIMWSFHRYAYGAAFFAAGMFFAFLLAGSGSAAADVGPGDHRMETLLAAGYEIKGVTFLPFGNLGMILQKGVSVYQCGKDENGKIAPCFPLASK